MPNPLENQDPLVSDTQTSFISQNVNLKDSLKYTNLDIPDDKQSEEAGGKSSNIIKSTINGRTITTLTPHQYTPSNPYINSGQPQVSVGGGPDDIEARRGAGDQL